MTPHRASTTRKAGSSSTSDRSRTCTPLIHGLPRHQRGTSVNAGLVRACADQEPLGFGLIGFTSGFTRHAERPPGLVLTGVLPGSGDRI